MPTTRRIIKLPYNIGDQVLLGGLAVTVDQIILSSQWTEYRVWYMAQEQLTYCYVTQDKLTWKHTNTKIGFLIPE